MSSEQEFNASNVERAVEKASGQLGISVEDIEYSVVDTGSVGFLGMGARDARILVKVPASDESTETASPEPEVRYEPTETEDTLTDQFSEPEPEPVETEDVLASEAASEGISSEDEPAGEATPDDVLEEIKSVTESFVSAMGLQARVDVYDAGDYIASDVVSDHTALLIGQKGETLDSLQHLINCASHQQKSFSKRIVLDSEGYRQRRVEAIQGMAHRSARRAVRENQDSKLPPMPSTERRIVHLYLEADESVTTYSEGDGDKRRVIVSPT